MNGDVKLVPCLLTDEQNQKWVEVMGSSVKKLLTVQIKIKLLKNYHYCGWNNALQLLCWNKSQSFLRGIKNSTQAQWSTTSIVICEGDLDCSLLKVLLTMNFDTAAMLKWWHVCKKHQEEKGPICGGRKTDSPQWQPSCPFLHGWFMIF